MKSYNLDRTNLTEAENLTYQQIISACNWENAYFARYWDSEKGEWVVDEEKQTDKIKELKDDKASDPEKDPDCDRWK